MKTVKTGAVFIAFLISAQFVCQAEIRLTIGNSRSGAPEVDEHSSLMLECRSTTSHVTWSLDGKTLSNTTRLKIIDNKSFSGGLLSRLEINSTEPDDAGSYRCYCPHSNFYDVINITVRGHQHHSHVSIDGPTKVELQLGSQLQLTCKADIHSQVEWVANDVRITDSNRDKVTETTHEQSHKKMFVLLRKNMQQQDFGKYLCRSVDSNHDHDEASDHHDEASVQVQRAGAMSSFERQDIQIAGMFTALIISSLITLF